MRQQDDIIERIIFGFPDNTNNKIIINSCIFYAKHFIYQKKINNDNNIEFSFPPVPAQKILIRKRNMYST